MESLIDAFKAMGKATYLDVAARLDIEPVEASLDGEFFKEYVQPVA
ncbi:TPA: hypothetical protein ACTYZR_001754 [Enterobacter hormaechei]|nr:hypothetical protein [Enterobacter hormaechei]HEO8956792.1 hypothetical protein [Enterobacter hormaechei subsp. steigerwaltii]